MNDKIPIQCFRHRVPLGDCQPCMDMLGGIALRETFTEMLARIEALETELAEFKRFYFPDRLWEAMVFEDEQGASDLPDIWCRAEGGGKP